MKRFVLLLLVGTSASACGGTVVCCDLGDGDPKRTIGSLCDGTAVSFARCPTAVAQDPFVRDLPCQAFCEAWVDLCPLTLACFSNCVAQGVDPPARAIACVENATECIEADPCWALVFGIAS